MLLTKEQISEQMRKHAEKKNSLHDLMEIMLESIMVAERGEFLAENPGNLFPRSVLIWKWHHNNLFLIFDNFIGQQMNGR